MMPQDVAGQLAFDWDEIERNRCDPDLLFNAPTKELLSRLPEGHYFDRKSASIDPKKLAETIVAFSNTDAKGGVIAVGIRDKAIEGFANVGEDKLNRLMRSHIEHCPSAICETKIASVEGCGILLFRVKFNPNRVVELTSGDVFVRVGNQNRRLSPEDILRLKYDRGEIPFELEPMPGVGMEDLDAKLISNFADRVRANIGLEYDTSNEDVLKQRNLLHFESGQHKPTIAALLLFGGNPNRYIPGCKVRFIRYEGIEERTGAELNVVKDILVEGTIPSLIVQAADVVFSQLREFQALTADGVFFRMDEYPRDCVYEAIVNACVHRSYAIKNSPIFIRMFDDRIEFESPGGFVPPVTAETVYEFHNPRNPILMDALRYFGTVRCANEGTRRMRHLMERSGLPVPIFRQKSDHSAKVVVTLRNAIEYRRTWVDHDLSRLVGEQLAASLTDDEKRVLNFLAENEKITVSGVGRITNVKSWKSARKIMDGLLQKHLVLEVKAKQRDPNAHFILPRSKNGNGGKKSFIE